MLFRNGGEPLPIKACALSDALALLAGFGSSNHVGFWLMFIGGIAAVIASAYILSANSNRARPNREKSAAFEVLD